MCHLLWSNVEYGIVFSVKGTEQRIPARPFGFSYCHMNDLIVFSNKKFNDQLHQRYLYLTRKAEIVPPHLDVLFQRRRQHTANKAVGQT